MAHNFTHVYGSYAIVNQCQENSRNGHFLKNLVLLASLSMETTKKALCKNAGQKLLMSGKKTFFYALNNMQQSRDDGELEAKTPTCRNQGTTADFISPLKRPH